MSIRITAMLMCIWCASVLAQPAVKDLPTEIEAGRIRLDAVAGNGNSSGTALTGYLVNATASTTHVGVHLSRPLYLVNSGKSQNMAAVQVYLSDGAYLSNGRNSFIKLRPRERTPVRFVAFCVDFEKDNPTNSDRFSVGSLPPVLLPVIGNIMSYLAANPNVDAIMAAQSAIWLAQDKSIKAIRRKIDVTPEDERLARSFLR